MLWILKIYLIILLFAVSDDNESESWELRNIICNAIFRGELYEQ